MRQAASFAVILVALCAGAILLFHDTVSECLSVLRTGRGNTSYVLTAVDSAGDIAVLGQKDGQYSIVHGSQSGNRFEIWELTAPEIPEESLPATFYIASGGAAYVGLYDISSDETRLLLYRITENGQSAELLLNEQCGGASLADQMAQTRLSAFAEVDSVVTFALLKGDSVQFYRRTGLSDGLEQGEQTTVPGLQTAVALADGSILAAGTDTLYPEGQAEQKLPDGIVLTKLIRVGTGVYFIDGAGLEVFYADCTDWQPFSALRLDELADTLDQTIDIQITRDGAAILLTNDGGLLLDRDGAVTDISAMLAPPAWRCALILTAMFAAVLLLTTVVWYLLCRQRRLPLAVRWGSIAAVLTLLALTAVRYGLVIPAAEQEAQDNAIGLIDSVTALVSGKKTEWDSSTVDRLDDVFSEVSNGGAEVFIYDRVGDAWYLSATNTGFCPGIRGELCPHFDSQSAQCAENEGTFLKTDQQGMRVFFTRCWVNNGRLLTVSTDGSADLAKCRSAGQWTERAMVSLALLLTAVVWICLCAVAGELHRVSTVMERLAAGKTEIASSSGAGDELAGLADSLTALSRAMKEQTRQQDVLTRSYRRFVPERILYLLGKSNVADVDKQTVVSRELTAMMLRFRFPPQVYESSGQELFDNINEILERTAPIVTRCGGAVFNFAYNGYDAVFENGVSAAVSAAVAVQQEMLELNRRRETTGAPPVTMRIAIDVGEVMIGIVGDRDQMEPTSVSSSFSTLGHLVKLCGQLEAGILCTQVVIAGASGYSSRYMGKCREGDALLRVYEIFDGDSYGVRKFKEQTGGQFSQGVYALYSRDFSKAKRIFLNLVHQNGEDGGARSYLYLADRLEKVPEQEISLDA